LNINEINCLGCCKKCISEESSFISAIDFLIKAERIACTGSGHSGIACAHFAHLLCCIERPARFLPPSEAIHGGMGFLHNGDLLVVASRGGKTEELIPIVEIAHMKNLKIITITENIGSPIAKAADAVIKMKVTRECDKYNSQGTTSFIVLSSIFDALQTALIEEMNYTIEKFAVVHPGGAVGKRLKKELKQKEIG
jgi:D-arabinose 5-phosphate isomerase GutQ